MSPQFDNQNQEIGIDILLYNIQISYHFCHMPLLIFTYLHLLCLENLLSHKAHHCNPNTQNRPLSLTEGTKATTTTKKIGNKWW